MDILQRLRDNPETIKEGLRRPSTVGMELNRAYHQLTDGEKYNQHGIDIFRDEDWDNLILLDACRYDDYAELTPFEGTVEKRESKGSASKQFVWGNFHKKELHDVVYVSGNQWYPRLLSETEFTSEVHSYHDVERDIRDGYVPSPEAVTNAALRLAKEHPNKRLIIHYMQPHKPYLGQNSELFTYHNGLGATFRESHASHSELLTAYRDNLRLVLEEVQSMAAQLQGKTVISSDHGELLGERVSPIPIRGY